MANESVKPPKLIDMKLSASARRAYIEPAVSSENAPQYPYGLCLRLEKDQLDKLGIKKLPAPGEEFHIRAVGKVDNVYMSQSSANRDDRSMSIQIVYLGLTDEPEPYDKAESAEEESAEENR